MPESSPEDIVIATAALLGGSPVLYAEHGVSFVSRYWTIQWTDPITGQTRATYGATRAKCAHKWLRDVHPEVKITATVKPPI